MLDECCVCLNEVKAMTNTPIKRAIYLYHDGVEYRDDTESFSLKVDTDKMRLRLFDVSDDGSKLSDKIKYKTIWPDQLIIVNEETGAKRLFDFEDTFEAEDWTIGRYNRYDNKYKFYLWRKDVE